MAICRECGCEYDPSEVIDLAYGSVGDYFPGAMDGLCFDCICDEWEDTFGEDPTDKFEDMSEEEYEVWNTEVVLEHLT